MRWAYAKREMRRRVRGAVRRCPMIKDGFRGGVDGAVRGWPLKKEGVCWGGGAWGGVRGEAEVLQQECSVRATLDAHQVADDQVGKWGAILGVGKANDGAIQAIDDFKVRKKML